MKKHGVTAVIFAILDGDAINDNTFIDAELLHDDTLTKKPVKALASLPHLFQGCSFTKSIMSFGIMLLIQQGKICLDDRVAEKLVSWKLPDHCDQNITIRQCLALTSGLAYETREAVTDIYLQTDPIPSLRNILEGRPPSKTGKICSQYSAGTYFSYSGAGYMLLQQLVEDITQQSYCEYINQSIFRPLGMKESMLGCPLPDKLRITVVPGYDMDGRPNPNGWYNNPYTASGGLWTTAKDMALFMQEIVKAFHGQSKLLYMQSLAIEMLRSQNDASFGLGFGVDSGTHLYVRKQGYNQGYYNQLIVNPENSSGLIIMTNSAAAKFLIAELIEYYMDGSPYNPDFDEVKTIAL